tara:strand:- start:12530 stop:13162 length:633 start_codon:yes stop_codon:yes gene_type:complete
MIDLKYKLGQYIQTKFKGINRKFTDIPYVYHLYNVAELAHSHEIYFGYEIGLCHDLFEDTDTQPHELIEKMVEIGYDKYDAQFVSNSVMALTKVYKGPQWTHIDKETKLEMETQRILLEDNHVQSIKYCDIIDNIRYNIPYVKMFKNDWKVNEMMNFIRDYLPLKNKQLELMTQGNKVLRELAIDYMSKNYEYFGLNTRPETKYIFPHEL